MVPKLYSICFGNSNTNTSVKSSNENTENNDLKESSLKKDLNEKPDKKMSSLKSWNFERKKDGKPLAGIKK